jgi:hypothetical protein
MLKRGQEFAEEIKDEIETNTAFLRIKYCEKIS